jgi:hypothetical protein
MENTPDAEDVFGDRIEGMQQPVGGTVVDVQIYKRVPPLGAPLLDLFSNAHRVFNPLEGFFLLPTPEDEALLVVDNLKGPRGVGHEARMLEGALI